MSTKSKRPRRSAEDLRADSATLRYEIETFVDLALEFDPEWESSPPTRNNAYVESFALRCRSLIFFLFGHSGKITSPTDSENLNVRPDDVLARDFDEHWESRLPSPADWVFDVKRRADKEVAHITVARRGLNQPDTGRVSRWDITRVAIELCGIAKTFLTGAPPEHFADGELSRMLTAIDRLDRHVRRGTSGVAASAPETASGGLLRSVHGRTAPDTVTYSPGFGMHGKTC